MRSLRRFFYKIKRLVEWFPVIWKGYDWDYAFVDSVTLYQLERLHKQLTKDSNFVDYGKRGLQSLRIAIKILRRRVSDELYVSLFEPRSEFKEGINTRLVFIPSEDVAYSTMITEHLTEDGWVRSKKLDRKYAEEIVKFGDAQYALMQRDLRNYHKIIEKYSGSWWS